MQKKSMFVSLSALAVLTAALWAPQAGANDVIKIGVAGAHTGDLAPYGLPTKAAAELVVAETNAKGGINGKKVELMVADDQCKPEIATNVATKLVSEGVNIVSATSAPAPPRQPSASTRTPRSSPSARRRPTRR